MFWPTKKELLSPPNADGEKCMHYPEDGTTSARERATRSGLEAQNSASTVQDAVDYRVGSIGGETGPLPRRRFSAQSAAATLGPHDAIWYPEGGQTAYFCAFGSFCGCMMSLGELILCQGPAGPYAPMSSFLPCVSELDQQYSD